MTTIRTRGAAVVLVAACAGAVYLVITRSLLGQTAVFAIAFAMVGLPMLASVDPPRVLLGLLAWMPVQTLVLAWLLRIGVPAPVIRPLGLAKEACIAVLVLVAVRSPKPRVHTDRFDVLDRLAVAYLVLVGIYFAVPGLFGVPGGPADLGQVPLYPRVVALRNDALMIVLFLAARHLPRSSTLLPAARRVVLVVGAFVAAVGLLEWAFPSGWERFLRQVIDVFTYQRAITGDAVSGEHALIFAGTARRIGSTLRSTNLGFFLVPAIALAASGVSRRRSGSWPALVVLWLALLLTLTRSAVLAGVIATVVAMRQHRGPSVRGGRVAVLATAAILVLAPLFVSSGLVERTVGALRGTEASAERHRTALGYGTSSIAARPFGAGLGRSAGAGQRFQLAGTVITENAYLQVGHELGLVGMVLFASLMWGLVVRLRAASMVDERLQPWYASALALAVGGLFLPFWANFSIAFMFWGPIGIALASPELGTSPSAEPDDEDASESFVLRARGPTRD